MNSEFHYHPPTSSPPGPASPPLDAQTIATASQYTDDNSIIFEIDKDRPTAYGNYISQTMNILKPKAKLFRIYPVFHFIPEGSQRGNRLAQRRPDALAQHHPGFMDKRPPHHEDGASNRKSLSYRHRSSRLCRHLGPPEFYGLLQ